MSLGGFDLMADLRLLLDQVPMVERQRKVVLKAMEELKPVYDAKREAKIALYHNQPGAVRFVD